MQTGDDIGNLTESSKPAQATEQHLNTAKSKQVSSEQLTGKFNPPFGVEMRATGYIETKPYKDGK